MNSLSQKHLIKLAQEDEEKNNLMGAIENIEQALEIQHSTRIVIKLCQLYCKNKQEVQAYALIKDEPDLFSKHEVFKEYCVILAANHYLIEALELENLRQEKLPIKVYPVDSEQQMHIMQDFRHQSEITQFNYQQLLKLNLINFKNFAQSLLLDTSQNFAVRLSLCEDLIRLGIKEKIQVLIIGDHNEFVPNQTVLLEKSTVYHEVIAGIGDKFRNNPSQLPIMLGEVNLVLGSLYPKLSKFIKDTDSFTSDLVAFLEGRDGYSHKDLFKKIYANLPK